MTTGPVDGTSDGDESLLVRAVRRRTGDRQATAEAEIRRLLDVGLALMAEDPSATPRIADIVGRAGVSNDAFYRAFRGKDDLMAAIADDGARRLISHVRHQRDKASQPREQIEACIRAVLGQAADPQVAATTRAVMRHTSRAAQSRAVGVADVRNRLSRELVGPLEGIPGTDPARDALVLACATFAVMEHFLWGEQVPDADDVGHLVSFLLRALPVRGMPAG